MNERIQALAEQAGFYYTDKTGFITPAGCDPAKFAELIVQECIDIISPYTVRMSRPGEEYLHPILEIKKRFGVAEREQ
jgi:hypothetical protein